uniref:Uncharacterized protein n=1 Tax=viral metagenome TaxID=1070528 RepID=A0A6H1ZKQ3_9ZZZZ
MKNLLIIISILAIILGGIVPAWAQEAQRLKTLPDNTQPPINGTYIYGGSIFTIKRLDNNDDWVEVKTPYGTGRYKYRVDCENCGECWHNPYGQNGEECYMVSESWEEMKGKSR